MDLIQAIILGIVQGLTEFLPISSSAHLRITASIAGWDDPGAAFTAVTQLGTETAVLLYFRHDLWRIARAWLLSLTDPKARDDPDARLGWFIVIATIPIGLLGFAFRHQIETGARNLTLIGTTLIVFALVLGYADRRGRHERELSELSPREGASIGVAQALALIPGVSRSGATMSAGLMLGLTRTAAARFSFLLAVPAVFASGLFELYGILSGDDAGEEPFSYVVVATVVAFVCGYAVIAWLLRYLVNHTMTVFVVYRLALGSVVLALVAAGAIG
jgi:undecaprenyl-diphosphatase